MKTGRRSALSTLLASALVCLFPASASATTYFARGDGSGGTCSHDLPCSITTAVTNASTDADAVVLEPGPTFFLSAILNVTHSIDIGGEAGQPPPTVQGSSAVTNTIGLAATTGTGPTLHDLNITQSNANVALRQLNGTSERVNVTVSGQRACALDGGLIRDSVCRSASGDGVIQISPTSTGAYSGELRNVTAIGGTTGYGIDVLADAGEAQQLTINAVNTIARGGTGDVRTQAGTLPATVSLTYSNYAQTDTSQGGTITAPGTNGNQTATPQFANLLTGDLSESAASPTVDAGIADPLLGPTDLARNPRSAPLCRGGHSIPDIGAFELVTPKPPAAECRKFSFGKLKRNKHRGTATLKVTLPGSGTLSLHGHGVVRQRLAWASSAPLARKVSAAGTVKLKIKAKGKAKRKLNSHGKVKLKLKVSFRPTGGSANTKPKRVKLVKRG